MDESDDDDSSYDMSLHARLHEQVVKVVWFGVCVCVAVSGGVYWPFLVSVEAGDLLG